MGCTRCFVVRSSNAPLCRSGAGCPLHPAAPKLATHAAPSSYTCRASPAAPARRLAAGNSEVGHNALGAGQLIDQGASLVDGALRTGSLFSGEGWAYIAPAFAGNTLHFIGLLSDGGVHSRTDQLYGCLRGAAERGAKKIRCVGCGAWRRRRRGGGMGSGCQLVPAGQHSTPSLPRCRCYMLPLPACLCAHPLACLPACPLARLPACPLACLPACSPARLAQRALPHRRPRRAGRLLPQVCGGAGRGVEGAGGERPWAARVAAVACAGQRWWWECSLVVVVVARVGGGLWALLRSWGSVGSIALGCTEAGEETLLTRACLPLPCPCPCCAGHRLRRQDRVWRRPHVCHHGSL